MRRRFLELSIGAFRLVVDVSCFITAMIRSKLVANEMEGLLHMMRKVAELHRFLQLLDWARAHNVDSALSVIRAKLEDMCIDLMYVRRTKRRIEQCADSLLKCIRLELVSPQQTS